MSKYDLKPNVVWKDGIPAGFESRCPHVSCARTNFSPFEDGPLGTLVWWPLKGHCPHFKGLYSSGRIAEPYAIFDD